MMDQFESEMKNIDSDKFHYVIYASEVVVYDTKGNRIVSCPTENEALEFIDEQKLEQ